MLSHTSSLHSCEDSNTVADNFPPIGCLSSTAPHSFIFFNIAFPEIGYFGRCNVGLCISLVNSVFSLVLNLAISALILDFTQGSFLNTRNMLIFKYAHDPPTSLILVSMPCKVCRSQLTVTTTRIREVGERRSSSSEFRQWKVVSSRPKREVGGSDRNGIYYNN